MLAGMGLVETAAELGPRRVRTLMWLALGALSALVGLAFSGLGGGGGGFAPARSPLVGGAVSGLCAEARAAAAAGSSGASGPAGASGTTQALPAQARRLGLTCPTQSGGN
ncbi:MAG: hypothetical protein M0Z42_06195 [Actinomycetota bacterium]|jgi:hypothetical protein|nr:hypothetical protein [Actinomycetota bacterium]